MWELLPNDWKELPKDQKLKALKRAIRKLSVMYHPDKVGNGNGHEFVVMTAMVEKLARVYGISLTRKQEFVPKDQEENEWEPPDY